MAAVPRENAMTTIAAPLAQVTTLVQPKGVDGPQVEAVVQAPSQEIENNNKPTWLFDKLGADSDRRYQRGLLLIELFQEGLNKMKAEQDIMTGNALLKHLDKTLSVPFEEPEKVIGDEAAQIIADGAEIMRNRIGYVPAQYSFMYEGTDILYQIKSDGSVFRRYSWAAETKEIYNRAQDERSSLKMMLSSGIYEERINKSQSRISDIINSIGDLSEREQAFVSGFEAMASGNVSLIA